MTTTLNIPTREPRRLVRRTFGPLAYCAALVPLSALATGRQDLSRFWGCVGQRLLGEPVDDRVAVPDRRMIHALIGLLFGLIGLVAAGLVVLLVARGALYGLVVDGPYTGAWGGPTRAGAWAVHFAVALGAMLVTLALTFGVARLHLHATQWLRGSQLRAWFVPLTGTVAVVVTVFVVAWTRQL